MATVGNIDVRILPTYKNNIIMAMSGILAMLTSLEVDQDRFTVLFSESFSKSPVFSEIVSIHYHFDGTDWLAFMDEGLTTPVPADLIGEVSQDENPSTPGLHPDFIAQKLISLSGGRINFYFEFSREFIYPNDLSDTTSISGILLYSKDQSQAINLNYYPFGKKDTDTFIVDAKLEI